MPPNEAARSAIAAAGAAWTSLVGRLPADDDAAAPEDTGVALPVDAAETARAGAKGIYAQASAARTVRRLPCPRAAPTTRRLTVRCLERRRRGLHEAARDGLAADEGRQRCSLRGGRDVRAVRDAAVGVQADAQGDGKHPTGFRLVDGAGEHAC